MGLTMDGLVGKAPHSAVKEKVTRADDGVVASIAWGLKSGLQSNIIGFIFESSMKKLFVPWHKGFGENKGTQSPPRGRLRRPTGPKEEEASLWGLDVARPLEDKISPFDRRVEWGHQFYKLEKKGLKKGFSSAP